MMKWFYILMLIASCSGVPKREIGGHQFLVNAEFDDGSRSFGSIRPQPERGFMKVENQAFDCKENTILKSGYYVKVLPLKSQGESVWIDYIEAEKYRVEECAIVGLWCSTTNKRGKTERGTNCVFSPASNFRDKNQQTYRLTDSIASKGGGRDNLILCSQGRHGPEYISKFHAYMKDVMVWKRDVKLWKKFCRSYRPASECSELLPPEHELKFGVKDEMLAEMALKILIDGKAKVRKAKGGILWTKVRADLKPACDKLMEAKEGP